MTWLTKTVCGLVLFLLIFAPAATANAQTESGSISIGGTVLGPAPENPPTIDVPVHNSSTNDKQVRVSGVCQSGLVIKVFRNAIFAGSALCQQDNSYEVTIDVIEGRNDLLARQYDLLNQPSPDSDKVVVFCASEASTPSQTSVAKFQLVIDYDYHFQGIFVGEGFRLPIHFVGGTGPYAVSVDWGDNNSDVASREETGEFFMDHTYETSGPKTVRIKVSDAENQQASLEFALIVSGPPSSATALTGNETAVNQAQWRMVLWASLTMGAISFAAGFLVATFSDTLRHKFRKPKS